MADVFISYSQKSPEPTKALADALLRKGYDVWWDARLVPGQRFDDVIRDELDAAEAAIVIWTPESVQSKYVRAEAGTALAWDKLIPVRVAELRTEDVPGAFRGLQTVDIEDLDAIVRALNSRDIRPQERSAPKRLSMQQILEALRELDPMLPGALEAWLKECQAEGFRVVTKKSIIIKSTIPSFGEVNFGTLFPDGTVQTNYFSASAEQLRAPEIASSYLDGLALLVDGGSVKREGSSWNWRVEVYGQMPKLSALLARGDAWIKLMKAARGRLIEAAASTVGER